MLQASSKKYIWLLSIVLHILILVLVFINLDNNQNVFTGNAQELIVNAVTLKDEPEADSNPSPEPLKNIIPLAPAPAVASKDSLRASEPMGSTTMQESQAQDAFDDIAQLAQKKILLQPQTTVHDQYKKHELAQHIKQDLLDDLNPQRHNKPLPTPPQPKVNTQLTDFFNKQVVQNLQNLAAQQKITTMQEQRMGKILDKYKALILQAIQQQWVIPGHFTEEISCELLIKLSPGGFVESVDLTRSSGNAMLDSSARAAVFRASPLPVPNNIVDFTPFKEFLLKVAPVTV